MSAKCPCSNSHVPEIQKLSKEYSNYSFFIIHSNRDENLEFSKKYFSELHLTIPVIQDEQAAIADLFKAYKTPHAFIINSTGDIIYRGGVSNSHISSNATKHYLADALQDIKSEQKIKISEAKTLGCIISRESD